MSLLKLKGRLKAIKSLDSILSALQVVTMVRMKRVKEKYAAAQGYLSPAQAVLAGRIKPAAAKNKILVVVTSNRGLCGGFNSQVIAKAAEFAKAHPDFSLITLGKRGREYFKRQPKLSGRIVHFDSEAVERPTFSRLEELWGKILSFDGEICVAYNSYQSTAAQIAKIYRLYPVPEELSIQTEPADFILEPEAKELTAALFSHYLKARFYQLILDSQMGELAARLMILKSAVDNAKDLIENLVVSINKARQAMITRDLSEIIGSAEALRGARNE